MAVGLDLHRGMPVTAPIDASICVPRFEAMSDVACVISPTASDEAVSIIKVTVICVAPVPDGAVSLTVTSELVLLV